MQEYSLPFLPPSHTILRLPPDTHIEPHVQQRPDNDVYHEQQRVVHAIGQKQVQHAETGGHQKKGEHSHTGRLLSPGNEGTRRGGAQRAGW